MEGVTNRMMALFSHSHTNNNKCTRTRVKEECINSIGLLPIVDIGPYDNYRLALVDVCKQYQLVNSFISDCTICSHYFSSTLPPLTSPP